MDQKSDFRRVYSIDLVKGLLIILVIVGHVLLGSIEENLFKKIIYSFHMPIFIAISGYLFNYTWLCNAGFLEILVKYKNRLIYPWLIAFVFYFIFHELQRSEKNLLDDLVLEMLFPFYHLWFIPGFLSWVLMARVISIFHFTSRSIIPISVLLSFLGYIISKNIFPIWFIHQDSFLLKFLSETIRPYYFVFFVIGIKYNEIISRVQNVKTNLILIIFIMYFYIRNESINFLFYYSFNVALAFWVLKKMDGGTLPTVRWIEWLGINSLGVYLWHVFPIIVIKYFFSNLDNLQYYLMMAFSISIFFFGYYFLNRLKVVRKLFFGLS